ncbi:tetraacyldisaccharide 4'-kinase, partial [Calditrichota bacterium]
TFKVPIISIGNITAGGTGKTPFTLFLIKHLIKDYLKIAVVSRGYGRKSKGVILASDGKENFQSVEKSGDEPLLIARKFPNIVVIVAEDRRKGIQLAIEQFNAELILLDDAFQHRKVNRDCDIVLIDSNNQLSNEKILPVGNLRERIHHLNRANITIFTKIEGDIKNDERRLISDNFNGLIFNSTHKISNITDRLLKPIAEVKSLQDKSVVAFSGIANPDSFKISLLNIGINVVDFIPFKDHQWYTKEHIKKIETVAQKNNCKIILTTEKDMVKLDVDFLQGYDLLAVAMEIKVKEQQELIKKVKDCIDSKIKIG